MTDDYKCYSFLSNAHKDIQILLQTQKGYANVLFFSWIMSLHSITIPVYRFEIKGYWNWIWIKYLLQWSSLRWCNQMKLQLLYCLDFWGSLGYDRLEQKISNWIINFSWSDGLRVIIFIHTYLELYTIINNKSVQLKVNEHLSVCYYSPCIISRVVVLALFE